MTRSRALVCCAVAITVVAMVVLACWWLFALEPPPLPATTAGLASEPLRENEPRPASVATPDEPGARILVAEPESAEEQARRRLFESFGARRVAANAGDLRVTVTAGERPLVAHEAFLVGIQKTWGDEQVWLEVARRQRPLEDRARTDVEGIARFPGYRVHGALVWVMHGQTMAWRTTGPILWKAVHTEIVLGPVRLHGTVHGPDGMPRIGAVVSATSPKQRRNGEVERGTTFVGVSDELGTFTLTGLPHGVLTVTCHGGDGVADEQRQVDASKRDEVRVRFGRTPGLRWWRGRVVDETGAVVRGPTELQLEDGEGGGGERRVETTADDGTFAMQLPPGTWRARAGTEAAVARGKPVEVRLAAADVERDVVCAGRQVLCRVAVAVDEMDVEGAQPFVLLHRDDAPEEQKRGVDALAEAMVRAGHEAQGKRASSVGGSRRFEWNGSTWFGWSGLPAGVYRLRCVGSQEFVGEPEGGFLVDLSQTSPVIVDVLLRPRSAAPTQAK